MFAKSAWRALRTVAFATIAFWAATSAASAQSGPFAGLGGAWTGTGHILLSNGGKERIRCRATYSVDGGGRAMQQSLRCASDSYNFELRADVQSDGNRISGNWSELTRSIGGRLSGRGNRGHIAVRVSSDVFTAEVNLTLNGNHQSVTIRTDNTQFTGASISLHRG